MKPEKVEEVEGSAGGSRSGKGDRHREEEEVIPGMTRTPGPHLQMGR